jgi:RNA polymerase sigma-70 factor (ECF subfamily)
MQTLVGFGPDDRRSRHTLRSHSDSMRRMTRKPVARRSPAELHPALALAGHERPAVALERERRISGIEGELVFDTVYSTHFRHVARWVRALGGMDADVDDISQEVFIVVRRKLTQYVGPSLPAWLYGITRKTVSDYRRGAWFRRLLGGTRNLDRVREQPLTAADPYERLEAQRILRSILEKLSAVRRTAFILFEIEGYSGEEIAELEQIPVATVYTRLHHARRDFLRYTAEISGLDAEEPPP